MNPSVDPAAVRRWVISGGISAILLVFFSLPLFFIGYFAVGHAIGGLVLLSPVLILQYPVLLLLRRVFPETLTTAHPDSSRDNESAAGAEDARQ